MYYMENELISTLKNLKENYHVCAIKAEFEAEGTRYEEAKKLKKIVAEAGLNFTIKIGGCEAIRDIIDAKEIGCNTIVAPMIETPYALEKFFNAINSVFDFDEQENIQFMINIETITGFLNLDKIITSKYFESIAGVVLGRVDMTASLGLNREEVNSSKIFDIAQNISDKMQKLNKIFVIGGNVWDKSIPFFKEIKYLSNFETRKIIFDAKKALSSVNIAQGINEAIEFEMLWLKYKQELNGLILPKDENRYKLLASSVKK